MSEDSKPGDQIETKYFDNAQSLRKDRWIQYALGLALATTTAVPALFLTTEFAPELFEAINNTNTCCQCMAPIAVGVLGMAASRLYFKQPAETIARQLKTADRIGKAIWKLL